MLFGFLDWMYHVADILTAASEGTFLAFVVDANEERFPAGSTRTIVILKGLSVVL